jgi:hypothetical protein
MSTDDKKYSGMTLNEMLFQSGLLESFDDAIRKKDRATLLGILKKVNIDSENGGKIIQTIFDNPKKYGYI